MIRVYIAAPYPTQEAARAVALDLAAAGIVTSARWLFEEVEVLSDAWARKDLADVARADIFIALNPAEWSGRGTGGRHVELGYALALRKPVILVGPQTHIFHHLSEVWQFEDAIGLASHVLAVADGLRSVVGR